MNSIRASRRKHHIIYKTTCVTTGRFYIGMHSTDNLADAYLGSGLRLLRSVKKHGADKHIREILEELPTREAAANREKEIITDDLRNNPQCLNCGPGGLGAVDRPPTLEETRKKLSDAAKAHYASEAGKAAKERLKEFHTGRKRPVETRAKLSAKRKAAPFIPRSEEAKLKTSLALQGVTKSMETVQRMKTACTGRRKTWREDGTWFWSRPLEQ